MVKTAQKAKTAGQAESPDKERKERGDDEMNPYELDKKRKEELANKDWTNLTDQIQNEYQLSYDHMKPKVDKWETRFKLYNNQRRDDDAIGDPMMFTIMQSVLASLYEDQLNAGFIAREEGDANREEHLNIMAEFDHDLMEKDVMDYDWDFDTCFFGVGYTLLMEFDRTLQVPIPEVLDPMTCLPDPNGNSVQGNLKGRNAMSFFYWEAAITQREIDESDLYFNTENLKQQGTGHDQKSLVDRSKQARRTATGTGTTKNKDSTLKGDNKRFKIMNGFTWWNGELVFVTLAEKRGKLIRFNRVLDEEGNPIRKIPIIDRYLFPIAHDLHGVSIPDLVEDKQRARAALQNMSLRTAKDNARPRYLFNTNLISNRKDLDIEHNKHIPVDGDPTGAIQPVAKEGVRQEVQYIIDILDQAAQRATATPAMRQGVLNEDERLATELNLTNQGSDTRYSLAAKVFSWSEKRFWRQWYSLYKRYFKEGIDEKIIRLKGAGGIKWQTLTKENIHMNKDPDVEIESRIISEQEKRNKRVRLQNYIATIANDPSANVRYGLKKLGDLSGLRKDEVNHLLPQNVDEMQAEAENDALSENERVDVMPEDDHETHLLIHQQASSTKAAEDHILAHKKALILRRQRPELFGGSGSTMNPTAGQGFQGQLGGEQEQTQAGAQRQQATAAQQPTGEVEAR